jgi:hypothetical protein
VLTTRKAAELAALFNATNPADPAAEKPRRCTAHQASKNT